MSCVNSLTLRQYAAGAARQESLPFLIDGLWLSLKGIFSLLTLKVIAFTDVLTAGALGGLAVQIGGANYLDCVFVSFFAKKKKAPGREVRMAVVPAKHF